MSDNAALKLGAARVRAKLALKSLTAARLTVIEILPANHDVIRDLNINIERAKVVIAKLESLIRRLHG